MTKLFLILLLITKHSLIFSIDIKLAIGKAIAENKDFNQLTPAENEIYTRQINAKIKWGGIDFSPVAYSAYYGNTSAFNWLLAKKVDDDWTNVLNMALLPVFTKAEPEIISALLIRGARTHYETTRPLFKQKLIETEKFNTRFPHLADSGTLPRIEQAQELFERHHNPLRWNWIKAAALVDSGRVEIIEETHK